MLAFSVYNLVVE